MITTREDLMDLIVINFVIIIFLIPIILVCFKRSDNKEDKMLGKFFLFIVILSIISFFFRIIQYNINF